MDADQNLKNAIVDIAKSEIVTGECVEIAVDQRLEEALAGYTEAMRSEFEMQNLCVAPRTYYACRE